MKRRSGGSSTDGHLGGSSSSLSQEPASNNGSTFSLPRSSSRVTESGYTTSVFPIPLPFGNYTPGNEFLSLARKLKCSILHFLHGHAGSWKGPGVG